jgi:hypothetical protein
MGEWEFEQKALVKAVDQALMEPGREVIELRLITPGGGCRCAGRRGDVPRPWGSWLFSQSFWKFRVCSSAGQALVWVWDGQEENARCWHLWVRREVGSEAISHYCLSNAPPDTP